MASDSEDLLAGDAISARREVSTVLQSQVRKQRVVKSVGSVVSSRKNQ